MSLLDIVIAVPLIGFLIVLFLPKSGTETIKRATFVISILVFLASLLLIPGVLGNAGAMSLVTDAPWMTYPNIRYHVGIDGVSLWLILLTTFLTPIAVLISWNHIDRRHNLFYSFLLLLEFGVIGVFAALDFFRDYIGRQHFGEAGRRQLLIGVLLNQYLTCSGIHQQISAGGDLRW